MVLGLTLAAPAVVAMSALAPGRADATDDPMVNSLVGLFAHRDSAARLGRRYLQAFPREGDRSWLVARILDDGSAPAASPAMFASDELRRRIARRRREDFTQSETVQVEGWILSRTEARLCALAALVTPAPAWG